MSGQNDAVLAQAIVSEAAIAEEAAAIRDDASELTPELFMKLYPLLCKPIPSGFIQTVPATKGKPYVSTGIRSVQVQIDRMNNVLTPMWWRDIVEYEDGGKLAKVTVIVGDAQRPDAEPLAVRTSRGGVAQGTGSGNIHKGSYTNAAKLAFARLGVGHEVYLGAADLDPDVNQEVAEQKGGEAQAQTSSEVGPGIAGKLIDRAWAVPSAKTNLQLAAGHVADRDIGDCSTKAKATEGLAGLTFEQAEALERWISKKETEAEVDGPKAGGGEGE